MNKKEFLKDFRKKNKSILKFEIYSFAVAILLIGLYFLNKFLIDEKIIDLGVFLINSLFLIVSAIVGVVFDIRHEIGVGKIVKHYKEKNEVLEYKDDVKYMKNLFLVMILFTVVMGIFILI